MAQESEKFLEKANNMVGVLGPLYAGNRMTIEQIHPMIAQLKEAESVFKEHLRTWLAAGALEHPPGIKEKAQRFIDSHYAYFSGESFFENELQDMNSLASESWQAINEFLFLKYKKLLERQVEVDGEYPENGTGREMTDVKREM